MDRGKSIVAIICMAAIVVGGIAIIASTCSGMAENPASPTRGTVRSSSSRNAQPLSQSQVAGYEKLSALTEAQRAKFLEAAGGKFGTREDTVLTVESDPVTGITAYFYVADTRGFHWHVECSDTLCAFARATAAEALPAKQQEPATGPSAIPAQQDATSGIKQESKFQWAGSAPLSDTKAAKAVLGNCADGLYTALGEYMAQAGYPVAKESNVIVPASTAKDSDGNTAFTVVVYSGNDEILVDVTYANDTGAYAFALSK